MAESKSEAATPGNPIPVGVLTAVAVAVVIGFTALFIYLARLADTDNEVYWARLMYLFGSAEAIAFTAVGWLFGREVNRQRAERAETQAQDATASAAEATQQAVSSKERGESLATLVKLQPELGGPRRKRPLAGPTADETNESVDLETLKAFAEKLFPSS